MATSPATSPAIAPNSPAPGSLRFQQVDVFVPTGDNGDPTPYRGNPVAVVGGGDHLSTQEMQRFAHWTNLSETTFLLDPEEGSGADYRVRIFTPDGELPFAGHPTLGTCHAWLQDLNHPASSPSNTEIIQSCAAGLIRIRSAQGRLAFAAPPLVRSGGVDDNDLNEILDALGISSSDVLDTAWIDNGPGWVGLLMSDPELVLEIQPKATAYKIGIAAQTDGGGLEVRAFYPINGVTIEDPVTGSLNASLAQWLLGTGVVTAPYVACQGRMLGRDGRIFIDVDEASDDIWVGGRTVTCIEGKVRL